MTAWTTNSRGGTKARPCPDCFLGVCLCTADDVRAWGDRLDELEAAIQAELAPFRAWAEQQENDSEGYRTVQRVTARLVKWQSRAASATRDTAFGVYATQQTRELVGLIDEGAAILESMRTRTTVDPQNEAAGPNVAGLALAGLALVGLGIWGWSRAR